MCGIAGLAFRSPRPGGDLAVRRGEVARMLQDLAHRGPDGEGIESWDGAVLGHRRLAVIDLSERARQPMSLRCGTGGAAPAVWITFNGEVYNHTELRRELEDRGHRFTSRSDTEVVLHLYEERGPACVEDLRGMFAFALWDAAARRLMLARDRLGKKPLYYRMTGEEMAFASEIKAICTLERMRGRPVQADPASLRSFLALKYVPGPRTAVMGIQSLPPACVLLLEDGRTRVEPYWRLPVTAVSPAPDAPALKAALEAAVREAVRLRLRSDVPVGLFLSGGLDSAILAAIVARLSRDGQAPQGLRAFTVAFAEKDYDEIRQAAALARSLGMPHEAIPLRPTARDTTDMLPTLAWHLDQPLADSSALATSHLARAVRRHVTVALSGDGADELFLGYDRYRAHRLASRLVPAGAGLLARGPARLAGMALRALVPGAPARRNLGGRARRFLDAMARPPLERNDAWITCVGGELSRRVLTDGFLQAGGEDPLEAVHGAYQRAAQGDEATDPLVAIQHADLGVYLPDDILRKVDLTTMAYGLEARAPWLDQEVVAAAQRIPIAMKLRGGRGKAILREMFAADIPPATAARRKAGFGLPLDHWLRADLAGYCRDVLLDTRTLQRGLVRREGAVSLIEEHVSGRVNHEDPLWALIMLEHWFRSCLEAGAAATPRPAVADAAARVSS